MFLLLPFILPLFAFLMLVLYAPRREILAIGALMLGFAWTILGTLRAFFLIQNWDWMHRYGMGAYALQSLIEVPTMILLGVAFLLLGRFLLKRAGPAQQPY